MAEAVGSKRSAGIVVVELLLGLHLYEVVHLILNADHLVFHALHPALEVGELPSGDKFPDLVGVRHVDGLVGDVGAEEVEGGCVCRQRLIAGLGDGGFKIAL